MVLLRKAPAVALTDEAVKALSDCALFSYLCSRLTKLIQLDFEQRIPKAGLVKTNRSLYFFLEGFVFVI